MRFDSQKFASKKRRPKQRSHPEERGILFGLYQTSFIDFYGGWSLQDSSYLGMTLKNGILFFTICFKKTTTQTVQSSRGTRDLVWASSNNMHRFFMASGVCKIPRTSE